MLHHLYLIPENINLKDVDPYAYSDSMQRDIHNKCKGPLSDIDPLYTSDEKEGTEHYLNSNSATVEMIGKWGSK